MYYYYFIYLCLYKIIIFTFYKFIHKIIHLYILTVIFSKRVLALDFSNFALDNTPSVPTVNNRCAIVDKADYAIAPKFFEKGQNNHACNCADFAETARCWRACFGLSRRHFLLTIGYRVLRFTFRRLIEIKNMSSASGDEAEVALAEPGKKGIPSNCRSVRSIARPLPRQSFVRKDVRSA